MRCFIDWGNWVVGVEVPATPNAHDRLGQYRVVMFSLGPAVLALRWRRQGR